MALGTHWWVPGTCKRVIIALAGTCTMCNKYGYSYLILRTFFQGTQVPGCPPGIPACWWGIHLLRPALQAVLVRRCIHWLTKLSWWAGLYTKLSWWAGVYTKLSWWAGVYTGSLNCLGEQVYTPAHQTVLVSRCIHQLTKLSWWAGVYTGSPRKSGERLYNSEQVYCEPGSLMWQQDTRKGSKIVDSRKDKERTTIVK
jgi:hypothetical protein